ncbi:MAG: Crp/Fnr family transcriptional regulator [Leptonema sp. (in: bacteria)]
MNIEELKKEAKLLHYKKGEIIYETKEYLSDIQVYYILKGEVLLRKKYTPLVKDEFIIKENNFFGVLEIYNSKIRLTDAEALTDVELLGFDKITFERALISNIQISLQIIRGLSSILRKANERIKNLP